VQQSIIDFLRGLSKSIIQGFIEVQKHGGIGNSIEEGIEKFRKKLFTTGVAISIAGTGFFLTLWGIASAIDAMFSMRGMGFVLIGLLGVLTGALIYKK
jgi:N-acetylglucosamine-6-phosphate deacetylase